MNKIPVQAACDYVYDQCYRGRGVGRAGYIWGAHGEKCTPAMRAEWARRAPDQATMINGTGAKWDGMYCWDCSGIFRGLTRELGTYVSGGATTIFNKRCVRTGRLATMPDMRGVAVFRAKAGSDTQMAHVGFYMGNGIVIHAKGTAYGVVREDISKHAWTHWGAVEYIAYDGDIQEEEEQPMNVLYEATVVTKTDANINLWSSSAKTKSMIKVPKGDTVEVLDATAPKGWVYARYRGVTGYADDRYLVRKEAPGQPQNGVWGVWVPCANQEQATQVAGCLQGAQAKEA